MDVSKFDRRSLFSGRDLACLICGIDPDRNESDAEIDYEFSRVKTDASEALAYILNDAPTADLSNAVGTPLFSNELLAFLERKRRLFLDLPHVDGMREIPDSSRTSSFNIDLMKWQLSTESHIENMTFDRLEVARWIGTCDFQSQYSFETVRKSSSKTEKPLKTIERRTLLTIIAVLCKEAKIPYEKSAKAAQLIEGSARTMGISIGETTIENHLKLIPDALETRMK